MPTTFDPNNHHYVPQVYLRNFCFRYKNEDRLYAYSRSLLNHPVPNKFSSYTPAQVCYAKNLYRLNNNDIMQRFKIDDDNIIEKEAFKRYENGLNKILSKLISCEIESKSRFISLDGASILVRALINMKKRNPFFLRSVEKSNTPIQTNEYLKNQMMADEITWQAKLSQEGLSLQDVFNKFDELIKRPNFATDLIRLSLYQEGMGSTDNAVFEISEILMRKVWFIYETTINNLFITSDNPGYCVNQDEDLFNLNFIEDFSFTFPLSPYHVLIITNQHQDKIIPPFKEITYRQATPELVQIVNRCSVANAFEFMYSNSKNALAQVISHWREFIGENSTNHFPTNS